MTCCDKKEQCHYTPKAKVGMPAPEFKGTAAMPDGTFKEISLSDFKGKYVVLYFYPLDFTYVCPSEIIAFSKAVNEFKAKNAEVIGCSVDSHFCHLAWAQTPKEKGGLAGTKHPLLSDITKQISKDYGVLMDNAGIALRGLFVIDASGILQHALINNLGIGRSVEYTLEVLDAIQHVEKQGEVCPAGWKRGAKAITPSAEGIIKYLKEST